MQIVRYLFLFKHFVDQSIRQLIECSNSPYDFISLSLIYGWTLCENCSNTEFFLVLIFPYSVRTQEKTDQKNFFIWKLSTQWKKIAMPQIASINSESSTFSGCPTFDVALPVSFFHVTLSRVSIFRFCSSAIFFSGFNLI